MIIEKKVGVKKGKRLAIKSDKSLRRTKFTLILAISSNGLVGYEILNHNCKKVDFIRFIENLKAPIGSTIVMDNIAFHHSKEVVAAISHKGMTTLYALSYSPKLNPVENVFGQIKPEYRLRCPPSFNKDFDYKHVFENTMIELLQGKSLSNFFNHIEKIAINTLEKIDVLGDHFIFCGYDL